MVFGDFQMQMYNFVTINKIKNPKASGCILKENKIGPTLGVEPPFALLTRTSRDYGYCACAVAL